MSNVSSTHETNEQKITDIYMNDFSETEGCLDGLKQGWNPNANSKAEAIWNTEISKYNDAMTKLTQLSNSKWINNPASQNQEVLTQINNAKKKLQQAQKDMVNYVNGGEKDQTLLNNAAANFKEAKASMEYVGLYYNPE